MNIRPAAVAGMFYPASKEEIEDMLDGFFAHVDEASPPVILSHVMIVPHAGYVYSGQTAAFAYHYLHAGDFERVVLFGPAHRVFVTGLALPESDAFATPLGVVPLNKAGMQLAANLLQVSFSNEAHRLEHSLEVQLPFLQRQLGEFELIPFVVGQATPHEVAEVINLFVRDEKTLVLISSDLSHFHPYEEARELDLHTCDALMQGDLPIASEQACGANIINGLYQLLQGASHLELLDYRNSGDTAGDQGRVVGYGAFALVEDAL